MSDFRVQIQADLESADFVQRELDWGRSERKWTLSEKESLEVSWLQGLTPSSEDLDALYGFFRINRNEIDEEAIVNLSPGELCLIHRNQSAKPSVFASLCEVCSLHWYVFRWDIGSGEWLVYGRDCDYAWKRGKSMERNDIRRLEEIRGSICAPTECPD